MKTEKNKTIKKQFASCLAFILLIMAGIFFTGCHNSIMEEWWYDKGGQKPAAPSGPNTGGGGGGNGINFGVVHFELGFEPDYSKGEGPQPKDINVLWDDTVGRLRPITRINYGFDGWLDEYGHPWDVETTKVEKDAVDGCAKADKDKDGFVTLTARWNQHICTVSFDTGEYANAIPDQAVAYGGKAVEPVMPTPTDGKGFAGWYNNSGYSGSSWNFSTDTVTSNITLYAKWEDNACLVDFNANGGTRPDGITQLTHTQSVAWGHPAQDPGPLVKFDASKKPSHTFAGWYDNPGFSGDPWDFANPVPSQPTLTLHAKWEINKYTISFETPDSVPGIPNQEIDHGSKITDPYDPVPDMPPGYGDFEGWYTKDGTDDGKWGEKWDFGNNEVTDNVKLYPRWKHSVIFVPYVIPSNVILLPDGAVTIPPLSVEHGAVISQPASPPELEDGRGFSGWWTKDGTNGDWGVQWNFSTKVTENLILYGKFMHKNRTVVFMPNGAQMSKTTYSVAVDSLITNPGNPVRLGYVFLGWYLNPNFTSGSKVNLATYKVPAPDVIDGMDHLYLYANWNLNQIAISFSIVDTNGDVIFNDVQSLYYGDRILRTPTVPAKLNHQLDGWYIENGANNGGDIWNSIDKWDFDETVLKSHDLFARWVAADYTVEFSYGSPSGGIPANFPQDPDDLKQYVVSGDKAAEPFMPPTPAGSANFVAWYDGGTQFDFTTQIYSNKTLTAKWVDDESGMVWVPRGRFVMGDSNVSGKTADYNAYPSQVITMDGFFIGETEVTQQQWAAGAGASQFKGLDRPVENITWVEANTYAAGSGSRLPTEKEWEYAAKGGYYGLLANNTYYTYSGSNNPSEVAWYNETIKPEPEMGTQPVKGKAANSLGIYGMSGNVAEWCADSITLTRGGSTERIIRGGSWSSAAGNVRNVMRNSQDPNKASWDVGFRVVRGPSAIY